MTEGANRSSLLTLPVIAALGVIAGVALQSAGAAFWVSFGIAALGCVAVIFSKLEQRLRLAVIDRKSTRLNSSHSTLSRMPSSA